MTYSVMTEAEIDQIVRQYVDYYNNHEDGCWTFEKSYRRIHQMLTIEDSLCLIQWDNAQRMTGFLIGYFKEFDDLRAYYLEEIVIFAQYQNKGYGTLFLRELETRILAHGATHLELTSVNDAKHHHFYTKFGMYAATNLNLMGKHYG